MFRTAAENLSTSVYISDWLIDNYQLVILIVITGGTKNIGRITCYMYDMRTFISFFFKMSHF